MLVLTAIPYVMDSRSVVEEESTVVVEKEEVGDAAAETVDPAVEPEADPNAAAAAPSGDGALEKLGVGEAIVQMAFGIPLAGIALGGALAFGFGGRDAAGRQIDAWKARDDAPGDE